MTSYPDVNRAAAVATPAPARPRAKSAPAWTGALLAAGAIITATGTFLPFEKIIAFHHGAVVATVTFTGLGSKSATGLPVNGLEAASGGRIILGLSILGLAAGVAVLAGRSRLGVTVLGLVASAVALVLGIATIGAPASDARTLNTDAATGWVAHALAKTGCYVVTTGAAVAVVAALLAIGLARRRS
jgi:hypothetical protein